MMNDKGGRCVTECRHVFYWNGLAFTGSAHIKRFGQGVMRKTIKAKTKTHKFKLGS